MDLNKGATTNLNLTKTQTYSIFPGQVVVAQGVNIDGTQFIAQNIYADATYALPPAPETLHQLQGKLYGRNNMNKTDSWLVGVFTKNQINTISCYFKTHHCFLYENLPSAC